MKFFFVLGIVLILFGVWGLHINVCHGGRHRTSIINTCDCVLSGFVIVGAISECIAAFIWAFS